MSASLRRSRRSRSATITRRRSGEHLARNCWSCPLSASTALMAVHPAAACCAIGTVLSIGQPVRAHQWTCSRRRLACARRDRWIRRWHPMRWQLVCCSSRDESLLISNPHDVDYTIGTIDSDDSGIDSEHRKQRRATFSRHRAHHHARLPQCCTCGMKGEHRAARNAAQNPPLFAYTRHIPPDHVQPRCLRQYGSAHVHIYRWSRVCVVQRRLRLWLGARFEAVCRSNV